MKKFQNNSSLSTAITLTLTLGLFACQKSPDKMGNGQTLVYCSEASPSRLNPQVVTDGTSFTASASTVFDRLVEFEDGGTKILPGLAHRWTISPDGLEYTFHLRKNIPFHSSDVFTPTRPLNSDDVIYTFERMGNPKHPLHNVSGGIYNYFESLQMKKLIKAVVREGDHQVKIILNQPEAPFLSYMASHFMSIMSKEYGEKVIAFKQPQLFDMNPVGTGPFVFKKYVQDTLIRYQSFKNHFSKAPSFDNLVISITPDPNVRFQKLKTGECHMVFEPSRSDLPAIESNPNIKLAAIESLNIGYLAMNTEKPPFNNVDVRRAVNLALNKKSYLDAIYLGRASLAKNPLPPKLWGYNTNIPPTPYDPDKARQLLAKAGFPKGFQTELWALPVSRPYNPDGRKMAEMMQADLKKVGIKAKIVSYDWGTYLDKTRRGEHQMAQLGWSADYPDPDNFMGVLLNCANVASGSNISRFCHKEFDELVQKAKKMNTPAQRTPLYLKAQEIFRDQAPWVPIAHSISYRAMVKNLEGYRMSPLGTDYFHNITLK